MAADTKAPELISYELSSYNFDLSDGDITINITARITDDISGVFDGLFSNGIGGSPSQARWRSPSGNQFLDAGVFDSPSSGNFLDGIYREQTVLNANSELGTWTLESFFVADEAGNTKFLNTDELASLGIRTTFEVTNDELTGVSSNPGDRRPGTPGRGGGSGAAGTPGGGVSPGRGGRPQAPGTSGGSGAPRRGGEPRLPGMAGGGRGMNPEGSPRRNSILAAEALSSSTSKTSPTADTNAIASGVLDDENKQQLLMAAQISKLVSTYQIQIAGGQFADEPFNPLAVVEVQFDDSKPINAKAIVTVEGGTITGVDATESVTTLSPFGDILSIPNTLFDDAADISIQTGSPLNAVVVGNNFRNSSFPGGSPNAGNDFLKLGGSFWELDTARIVDGFQSGSNNFYAFDGTDLFEIDAPSNSFRLELVKDGFDEERAAGYTVVNLRFDSGEDFQIYLTGVEFIQFSDGYIDTRRLLAGIDLNNLDPNNTVWQGRGFGETPGLTLGRAPDIFAPSLVSTSPLDNATNTSVGADISLTFSENIKAGNGSISIKKVGDNSNFATISISDSSQVSFNGNTVTINPLNDLAFSTDYFIEIGSGAIQDFANNSYAGISSTTTLNFRTVDGVTGVPTTPAPGRNPGRGGRTGGGGTPGRGGRPGVPGMPVSGGAPGRRRLAVSELEKNSISNKDLILDAGSKVPEDYQLSVSASSDIFSTSNLSKTMGISESYLNFNQVLLGDIA